MKFAAKNFFFLFFSFALFIVDFLSKIYVHNYIPHAGISTPFYPYGGKSIFYNWHGIDFSIVHVTNKGAAWGLLAPFQNQLMWARFGIIAILLGYALFLNKDKARHIPLALIITGALSNVADFFLYGHVVDMFRLCFWGYHYPVFNIADSLIFLGVVALFWQSFRASPKAKVA